MWCKYLSLSLPLSLSPCIISCIGIVVCIIFSVSPSLLLHIMRFQQKQLELEVFLHGGNSLLHVYNLRKHCDTYYFANNEYSLHESGKSKYEIMIHTPWCSTVGVREAPTSRDTVHRPSTRRSSTCLHNCRKRRVLPMTLLPVFQK